MTVVAKVWEFVGGPFCGQRKQVRDDDIPHRIAILDNADGSGPVTRAQLEAAKNGSGQVRVTFGEYRYKELYGRTVLLWHQDALRRSQEEDDGN